MSCVRTIFFKSHSFFKIFRFYWSIGIKLMPLSVFYNQNKRACTDIVSHNALLMGFLVLGRIVSKCLLISL
ncbi:hypothetical protein FIM38_01170 [Helicobacter pylori]|nr:hypothetical protein FIM38_01170 [Helicobacter pylori]